MPESKASSVNFLGLQTGLPAGHPDAQIRREVEQLEPPAYTEVVSVEDQRARGIALNDGKGGYGGTATLEGTTSVSVPTTYSYRRAARQQQPETVESALVPVQESGIEQGPSWRDRWSERIAARAEAREELRIQRKAAVQARALRLAAEQEELSTSTAPSGLMNEGDINMSSPEQNTGVIVVPADIEVPEKTKVDGARVATWVKSDLAKLRQQDLSEMEFPLINQYDLTPGVQAIAAQSFDMVVDPMISQSRLGTHLRGVAQYRASTAFEQEADAVQTSSAGMSARRAERMPNRLTEERNRQVLQVANKAGMILGNEQVMNMDITIDDATQMAFGLLGVVTYHSEIDDCRIVFGDEVTAAIEGESNIVRAIAEGKAVAMGDQVRSTGDPESLGAILGRNDTYYPVQRPSTSGHDYRSIFLVADENDQHYLAATRPLDVQSAGRARRVKNEVSAIPLHPKVVSRVQSAMFAEGQRAVVDLNSVQTEVSTNAYYNLIDLNKFIGDEADSGSRSSQPVSPWTPEQVVAQAEQMQSLTSGQVVEAEILEDYHGQ